MLIAYRLQDLKLRSILCRENASSDYKSKEILINHLNDWLLPYGITAAIEKRQIPNSFSLH